MNEETEYIKGRGAQLNPHNKFNKHAFTQEHWEGIDSTELPDPATKYIEVFPKTIINKVDSPDIGPAYSMNPYQGCEHGCTYCYARPTHEYWGYSAGLDFEKVILVKKNAAALLEKELQHPKWEVMPIMLSGNTDCYQPAERKFGITRKMLEVLLKYRHPVGIITKNVVLLRDLDILSEMAKMNLVSVTLSITSLQEEVRRILEPRTATIKRKLEAIEILTAHGIPVNVNMAPVIPSITDHEMFTMMKEVSQRGALSLHYIVVRLNGPNGEIFRDWVTKNYPDRAEKVLNQIMETHGGKLNDSRFGKRMSGEGNFSMAIKRQYQVGYQKFFKDKVFPEMNCDLFVRTDKGQMSLF
ncbi:MAG TPA: PA0069 family radical SAM protein [Flavobacteriales bacterium]|nr:PA0069 family radical SAM protein [Flavobacteriales bacterium]